MGLIATAVALLHLGECLGYGDSYTSRAFSSGPGLSLMQVATTVGRRTESPSILSSRASSSDGLADVKGTPKINFDTIEHSEKFASMLQLVVAQVNLKAANGTVYDMSPEAKAALDIVKDYLDMQQQSIIDLHQAKQNEINDAVAKVVACSSDHFGTTSVYTRRDAHATCRGAQGQLSDVETAKCDIYDEHRALPAPQCSLNHRTSDDPTHFAQFGSCLEEYDNWSSQLYPLYAECSSARELVASQTGSCNAEQSDFEVSMCGFHWGFCVCSGHTRDHHGKLKEELTAVEKTWKADYEARARMTCLVDILVANETNDNVTELLQNCSGEVHNATFLLLDYGVLPPKVSECHEATPCEGDFLEKQYRDKPWFAKAPSTDCRACGPHTSPSSCYFGNGVLGALVVNANESKILDTDSSPGGFNYTSVIVAAGGRLEVEGSRPLIIRALERVEVFGVVNVSGGRGANAGNDNPGAGGGAGGGALRIASPSVIVEGAVHADGGDGGNGGGNGQGTFKNGEFGDGSGGKGRAGGHDGGAGSPNPGEGASGSGPGASRGGLYMSAVPPGAGGAGHAFRGRDGFSRYGTQYIMPGGPAYGDAMLSQGLLGGSGGGGGGNDWDNEEGAGGGGSGGTIHFIAESIVITGKVSAVGGLGGTDDFHYNGGNRLCCNNGGPGSVGRIRLDYHTLDGTTEPPPGFSIIPHKCGASM